MKISDNNIEQLFNDSLKDYELPFDEGAWSSVSSRLDQMKPPANTPRTGMSKWSWTFIAVGVLGICVGGFYFLNDGKTSENMIADQEILKVDTIREHTEMSTFKEVKEHDIIQNKNNSVQQKNKVQHQSVSQPIVQAIENDAQTLNVDKVNEDENYRVENIEGNVETDENTIKEVVEPSLNYVSGEILNPVVCQGEKIIVKNTEKNALVRFVSPTNHNNIELIEGEEYKFIPKHNTSIQFLNESGNIIEEQNITVNATTVLNFNVEANIFEEGLPVVRLTSNNEFEQYQWTVEGKLMVDKTQQITTHLYQKGSHKVQLKATDQNGCTASIERNVYIKDDYNLMTVDAFRPNDSDVRNKTFMPFSLTKRNVDFKLVIIDPTNNSVVFESENANNPWDGKDTKTGEMTTVGKVFLWKVQIFNPLKNEPKVYTGTVLHY